MLCEQCFCRRNLARVYLQYGFNGESSEEETKRFCNVCYEEQQMPPKKKTYNMREKSAASFRVVAK